MQIVWLKNVTTLLTTPPSTEPVPLMIVTRLSQGSSKLTQHDNNSLPDENDAVVVDAEITELAQTTSTSASGD